MVSYRKSAARHVSHSPCTDEVVASSPAPLRWPVPIVKMAEESLSGGLLLRGPCNMQAPPPRLRQHPLLIYRLEYPLLHQDFPGHHHRVHIGGLPAVDQVGRG